MKVGTDGVLLGAWATATTSPTSVLDIGTGTGLIALMLAQRFPLACIEAVELDAAACQQASENFAASPWAERLRLHAGNFLTLPTTPYDMLVANPPYFENALPAANAARGTARHTQSLGYAQLVAKAAELLQPAGTLHLVLPTEVGERVRQLALQQNLHLHARCYVRTTPPKAPKRVLMRFGFDTLPCAETELVLEEERHRYSAAFEQLTQDFYLPKRPTSLQ